VCPKLSQPVTLTTSRPDSQQAFLAMLPKIMAHLRVAFRGLLAEAREEAIQDAVGHTLAAYLRLVGQNRTDRAFPTVLAHHAVGHVRDGRMVGAAKTVGTFSHARPSSQSISRSLSSVALMATGTPGRKR
jgi:hypothetical protein